MRIDTTGKPMMSDKEIGIIEGIIVYNDLRNCFEYGSGNSTLYFPKLDSIEMWYSVEHNGHYANYLRDKIGSNTLISFIQDDTEAYIRAFLSAKKQLDSIDLVLIDGIERMECLKFVLKHCDKNTIVLLHDSARQESVEILKYCMDNGYIVQHLSEGEKLQPNGFYAHRGLARIYP